MNVLTSFAGAKGENFTHAERFPPQRIFTHLTVLHTPEQFLPQQEAS